MEDVYVSGIDQKLPMNYEKIKYFHNASNQEYPIVIVNSMDTITNYENAWRLEINGVSDHPTLMFTLKPGECNKPGTYPLHEIVKRIPRHEYDCLRIVSINIPQLHIIIIQKNNMYFFFS
jgi:hypothetical protein